MSCLLSIFLYLSLSFPVLLSVIVHVNKHISPPPELTSPTYLYPYPFTHTHTYIHTYIHTHIVAPLFGEFLEQKGRLKAALKREEELAASIPGYQVCLSLPYKSASLDSSDLHLSYLKTSIA